MTGPGTTPRPTRTLRRSRTSPAGLRAAAAPAGRSQTALAWAGIVGPLAFTATFLALETTVDGYSRVADPVSALEAGPDGWVQQVSFAVFGVLTMAHAVGLHRGMPRGPGGLAGPALLALTGVGCLVAASFPLRSDGAGGFYDPGGHVVGGMLFFLGSPVALVLLSRRMWGAPGWHGLARWALAAGMLLFVMAFVTMRFGIADDAPLHDVMGVLQRVSVLLLLFPVRVGLGIRLVLVSRAG